MAECPRGEARTAKGKLITAYCSTGRTSKTKQGESPALIPNQKASKVDSNGCGSPVPGRSAASVQGGFILRQDPRRTWEEVEVVVQTQERWVAVSWLIFLALAFVVVWCKSTKTRGRDATFGPTPNGTPKKSGTFISLQHTYQLRLRYPIASISCRPNPLNISKSFDAFTVRFPSYLFLALMHPPLSKLWRNAFLGYRVLLVHIILLSFLMLSYRASSRTSWDNILRISRFQGRYHRNLCRT
ncbi:hypothetical protein C8J57DRAFT_322149 [Mycena rebaudengoi]|nr:hypothetical protein C8J57DRAFT_322149 [Mycena rebaudengoi]